MRKHPNHGFVTYFSWPLVLLSLKRNPTGEFSLVMSKIENSVQDFPLDVVAIPPSFKNHPLASQVVVKEFPADMSVENRKFIDEQIAFYSGYGVGWDGGGMRLMMSMSDIDRVVDDLGYAVTV